jgi:hypothetical protein
VIGSSEAIADGRRNPRPDKSVGIARAPSSGLSAFHSGLAAEPRSIPRRSTQWFDRLENIDKVVGNFCEIRRPTFRAWGPTSVRFVHHCENRGTERRDCPLGVMAPFLLSERHPPIGRADGTG